MPDCFLSCDWGTSAFRLRLVQAEGARVLAEVVTDTGIAEMHNRWTAAKRADPERIQFYQAYLKEKIKALEMKTGATLHQVPVLVSGMASSTIGMLELPYKELPFNVDGSDLNVHIIAASAQMPHTLVLISGVCTGDDVIRGEETLLVGCAIAPTGKEQVFLFPGTHSKHVWVRNGAAHHFQTFMTGEVFELLSTKSILSNSVQKNRDDAVTASFEIGVLEGTAANLLNSAFHVRTAHLFKKFTPEENYHYLSGLLIGAELKELVQKQAAHICLVCGEGLEKQYRHGLALLGLHDNLEIRNADAALVQGQLRIYEGVKSGRYATVAKSKME